VDGGAFPQEFRVRDHIELVRLGAVLFDNPPHAVARADGHSRFVDDDFVAIQCAPNLGGDSVHILEVGFARLGWRRAYADKDNLRVANCLRKVGRRLEAVLFQVPLQEVVQPWFVNGRLPFVNCVHLRGVDVYAENLVPQVGEHDARDQPDIACADDGDLHNSLCALFLAFALQDCTVWADYALNSHTAPASTIRQEFRYFFPIMLTCLKKNTLERLMFIVIFFRSGCGSGAIMRSSRMFQTTGTK
jgi:hypothetical protein